MTTSTSTAAYSLMTCWDREQLTHWNQIPEHEHEHEHATYEQLWAETKIGREPVWWLWLPQSRWSRWMSSPGWWSGQSWEVRERGPPPSLSCVFPSAGSSPAPPQQGYVTGPRGSLPALLTEHVKEIEHIVLKFIIKNPSFFISLLLRINFHIHGLNRSFLFTGFFKKFNYCPRKYFNS